MFKFLKEKLQDTVKKFTEKAEEKAEIVEETELQQEEKEILEKENKKVTEEKKDVEKVEKEEKTEKVKTSEKIQTKKIKNTTEDTIETLPETVEEVKEEKKGFLSKLFSKKTHDETNQELKQTTKEETPEIIEDKKEVESFVPAIKKKEEIVLDEKEDTSETEIIETPTVEEKEETSAQKFAKEALESDLVDTTKKKKGLFSKIKEKIVKFQLTDEAFDDLFWEFEIGLLESNMAVEVIEKIKDSLKEKLTQENVSKKDIHDLIMETLKETFEDVLSVPTFDLIDRIKAHEGPFVIAMIGVNGSGKTTTLAKIIHLLQKHNFSIVVAASDTFRAAAIQQLEEHTTKLGVKLIKHDYNADPAAVAFDAIKHAKAKKIDVVMIDTAGRLQTNNNLMDELKKVIRVSSPDLKIFIGESVTGNDCVEQSRAFNEAVGIDGIVLSKADIDENGGAAISVGYVTGKPILYLGTGQDYEDLERFEKDKMLEHLGF